MATVAVHHFVFSGCKSRVATVSGRHSVGHPRNHSHHNFSRKNHDEYNNALRLKATNFIHKIDLDPLFNQERSNEDGIQQNECAGHAYSPKMHITNDLPAQKSSDTYK